MTFYTRTVNPPDFPDRLQVRRSINGGSVNVGTTPTDVGDFTVLMLDINPTYTTTGYPSAWTQFTVTVSGLASPTIGRLAFRYFVENGGPNGTNSTYIGIDTFQFNHTCTNPTPTPSPTPTATATATVTPTATATATATGTPVPTATPPFVSISGTVLYCSNPAPGPVPSVTLTLTGSASASTVSDSSGNYTFSALPSGATYTVTPAKPARAPGSQGINTVDVIAVQRHFLSIALLTGCRLTAANVDGVNGVNTVDVIAVQRFFLSFSTGIANVG